MSDTSSFNSADIEDKPPSRPSSGRLHLSPLFSDTFGKAPGRAIYVKILCAGCFAIVFVIFAVFSIYWGALWKIPARPLGGLIFDFDGGPVGTAITSTFLASPANTGGIHWRQSNILGTDASDLVRQEQTWVAVVGALIAFQHGLTSCTEVRYS